MHCPLSRQLRQEFITPWGNRKDCREVDVAVVSTSDPRTAGPIRDRRVIIAGYRLAELLNQISQR